MIEQVDQQLQKWARDIVPDSDVSLSAPRAVGSGCEVSLYLVDLLPSNAANGGRRRDLQVLLRYLVTSCAESTEDSHRALGRLLFAAMEHSEYEVDLSASPANFWVGFGIAPQPCFFLRAPCRYRRPAPDVGMVRKPPEFRLSGVRALHGRILGPDDIPIPNAEVELVGLDRRVRTDTDGRFRLSAVSTIEPTARLRVRAKEKEWFVDAPTGGDAPPLLIHFDPTED